MNKPAGYDTTEAKAGGGFSDPDEGPYIMKIVRAFESVSKAKNNQLVIELDIAQGEFTRYYEGLSGRLEKDVYPKYYQLTDGKHLSYFKGNVLKIEASNPGFKFNFDENTLSGKLVGAMMLKEKYKDKEGKEKSVLKPRWLFAVQDIGKQKVPTREAADEDSGDPGPTDDDYIAQDNQGDGEGLPF